MENHTNDLKSNMDRFIVRIYDKAAERNKYLKSNMDRFIGETKLY